MADIDVTRRDDDADPLRFRVVVADAGGRSEHDVTASRDDFERLARPLEPPEGFMRRGFEFLLAREPKESIMRSFDISVIGTYFPEFEDEISS